MRKVLVFLILSTILALNAAPASAQPSWAAGSAYAEYMLNIVIGADNVGNGTYKWMLIGTTGSGGRFRIEATITVAKPPSLGQQQSQFSNITIPLQPKEETVEWSRGDQLIFLPKENLSRGLVQYIKLSPGGKTYKAYEISENSNTTWYDYETGILLKGYITYSGLLVKITLKSTNVAKPFEATDMTVPIVVGVAVVVVAAILLIYLKQRRK